MPFILHGIAGFGGGIRTGKGGRRDDWGAPSARRNLQGDDAMHGAIVAAMQDAGEAVFQ